MFLATDGRSEGIPSVTSNEQLFDNKLVWMNSDEAACYLRMSVGALRTAVWRSQIRPRKWRRRLYFKRVELDLLLEGATPRKRGR